VYNPLNKLVWRIKMTILISIAVAALPMGISVMMWGYNQQSDQLIYASFGIIGAGFLAWYGAYRYNIKEQDKTQQRHNELMSELKGIREDLSKR
jgi:hypothetical protein